MKLYLFRKMPFVVAAAFLVYRRKFIVDRVLLLLLNKTFIILGDRYPRLAFLKTAATATAPAI